ncbi:MAG: DUF3363 domain-containing protein [Treponema sp.]|jgi:hypothetical protein|nr:DUF3363 domain-containing protein [Treponema sp.]
MRHFLFEDKEYRINPYFKRRKKEQDSAVALSRLLRRLGPRSRRGSGGNKTAGGGGLGRSVDARQKCVVKMNYSDSIEAHRVQLEQYLVREGKGLDGGKPELYGTDIDEYRDNMVGKNFRIFLSPQSDRIDLANLAERFIKKLEQQTGYTLYWQAANHYNTAHPHAHLLINGKDKDGKEVDIPRDVVKTFMREYARDICTAQIGYRTPAEIEIDKEKQLEAPRFTHLDKTINELCGNGNRVNLKGIIGDRERVRILTRLENLRKIGLCTYEDGSYQLSHSWEEDLRANGRYNTFLKARSQLQYADPSKLKVYTGEHGTISGKVTKIYRTDDDTSDNHAVVIESLDGKTAYFVPLFKTPEMFTGKSKTRLENGKPVLKDGKPVIEREKTKLREGETVSIKTYESQRGRLTPVIFKQTESQLLKGVKND